MIKAILFDLDNTLLDFSRFKREGALAAAKAMRRAGAGASEKELYSRIFEIYAEKGIEYQNTFGDLLHDLGVNMHVLEHAKQAGIIAYTKKKFEVLKPHPKVLQTLSSLRSRYKLAIVTDAPRDKAWQRLILSGLDGYFYPVVSFNDTGEHKPAVAPFKRALELLKLAPASCLYVGDRPERDIIGAKKAGLHTCLAKYGCEGYQEESDVSDYKIERFEELLGVVKEIEE
jgi:putative hydrolase of the HAD superfamily